MQGVSSKFGLSTIIYAEKLYKTDFTQQDKKLVLSLHYNGGDSYLFVNGVQQSKFKTKDSKIKTAPLSLGGISDLSTTNAQKTGLFGCVHDFAVDYVPVTVGTIHDNHGYLMKKMVLYKMFSLMKKILILVLASTINAIPCVSLKSQECKVREVIVENKCITYPYNVKVSRCNGSCNNITNPYSKVCVTDITKNVTLKVFDLMILTNKTKQIIIHKSCKCVCRLDSIVCNSNKNGTKVNAGVSV